MNSIHNKGKTEDKSVGIRLPKATYDKLLSTCEDLGEMPLNRFAQQSIESALEMIDASTVRIPKWIAIQRYKIQFDEGEELS